MKLAVSLPQSSAARTLLLPVGLDAFGMGAFLGVAVVYFTERDLTYADAALIMSALGLGGVLGSALAGRVADRVSSPVSLSVVNVGVGISNALFLLPGDGVVLIMVGLVVGVLQGAAIPVRRLAVYRNAAPESPIRLQGYVRVVQNVAVAVASVGVAAAIAALGTSVLLWVVVANVVTHLAAGAVAWRLPRVIRDAPQTDWAGPWPRGALRDRPYMLLMMLFAIASWVDVVVAVGIPIWLDSIDGPLWMAPAALAANTVIVAVFQVWANGLAEEARRASLLLAVSLLLLAVGLVGLALVRGSVIIVIIGGALIVLALSIGEVLAAAGGWGLSFLLPPPERQGAYGGVMGSTLGLASGAGPLIVGAAAVSGPLGWVGLAGLCVVASPLARVVGRSAAERTRLRGG